uniref:peptidyl-tRNA hydrolase n=1 Tax=Acartia pacifica TaxID=335913 RepID=A0A0U2T3W8_ACAPC|nr:mitochondrial peptidyl-tRNA hydrolase 2-like protein [Acartia pacifica]
MEVVKSLRFWQGAVVGFGFAAASFTAAYLLAPSNFADEEEDDKDLRSEDSAVFSSGDDEEEMSDLDEMEDTKMVLVARNDLKTGKGKAAAQCSHATLDAYIQAKKASPKYLKAWRMTGQPKVTLKCESEDELHNLLAQARSLKLVSTVIADAGRTQIVPGSKTVLAIGPGPSEQIDLVTGHLKLY